LRLFLFNHLEFFINFRLAKLLGFILLSWIN